MSEPLIKRIQSDEEILATYEVMRQLRPHLQADTYLTTVCRMMDSDGYRLVALYEGERICAVAGYRLMEMLNYGCLLKVDDLSTDEGLRAKGYGSCLLAWLKEEGRKQGCEELHLDSGVQRERTHRFYFREELTINCFHFRMPL